MNRFFFVTMIFFFTSVSLCFGETWQTTLKAHFDIVDTFDELQNWQGGTGYHYDRETMPKKKDGNDSIWNIYTNDTPAKTDWIKDHGDYTWQRALSETPKSACINYLFNVSTKFSQYDGYGPSRLGTFFGDGVSPKSGYKKIHVFFMLKFPPNFFKLVDGKTNEFEWVQVLKFLDITSGFTESNKWGTDAEIATIDPTETLANFQEYGFNGTLFNIAGGGASWANVLAVYNGSFILKYEAPWWESIWAHTGHLCSGTNYESSPNTYLNLADSYLNNKWMALEFIMDRGTVDTADGSLEVYLYDETGNVIGHNSSQVNTLRMVQFDHYYNKVIFGGNRLSTVDGISREENRFFIDDVIIDESRIGLKYFELLFSNAGTEIVKPGAPVLRIKP